MSRRSRIDGMAMPTRISTGTRVQTTSISVLCELRDGTGFALRRKRYERKDQEDEDEDADERAKGQQPIVVEGQCFLADRRNLVLNSLAAVGLADPGRWKCMADAAVDDRRLGRVRLARVLSRPGRRRRRCRSAGRSCAILGRRGRRSLRGCRCHASRGQSNRPSNQSHCHPGLRALEPDTREPRPRKFGGLYRRGFSQPQAGVPSWMGSGVEGACAAA